MDNLVVKMSLKAKKVQARAYLDLGEHLILMLTAHPPLNLISHIPANSPTLEIYYQEAL